MRTASDDAIRAAITAVNRLVAVYRHRRSQLAAVAGVSEQQWEVLEDIATEHFMPSLFATRREVSRAAISKILRQLTDKGLVEAVRGTVDRRVKRYTLTASGRRALDAVRAERERAIAVIWKSMSDQDVRRFASMAHDIAGAMEEYAAQQERG